MEEVVVAGHSGQFTCQH